MRGAERLRRCVRNASAHTVVAASALVDMTIDLWVAVAAPAAAALATLEIGLIKKTVPHCIIQWLARGRDRLILRGWCTGFHTWCVWSGVIGWGHRFDWLRGADGLVHLVSV